jgi:hypothetical protein
MTIDMPALLAQLAQRRPIFHSEADFQHALAWLIHVQHPTAQIRLETRPERGIRLDILVRLDDDSVAIELKYLVARFEGTVAGERFDLPNQGAHDISRHDAVKDIARVERFVADGVVRSGWAVVLTNDSSYWRPGTKAEPIDAMFRIFEGRTLTGTLEWGQMAGAGTTRKRDVPLALTGSYGCAWRDYSTIEMAVESGSRSATSRSRSTGESTAPRATPRRCPRPPGARSSSQLFDSLREVASLGVDLRGDVRPQAGGPSGEPVCEVIHAARGGERWE